MTTYEYNATLRLTVEATDMYTAAEIAEAAAQLIRQMVAGVAKSRMVLIQAPERTQIGEPFYAENHA